MPSDEEDDYFTVDKPKLERVSAKQSGGVTKWAVTYRRAARHRCRVFEEERTDPLATFQHERVDNSVHLVDFDTRESVQDTRPADRRYLWHQELRDEYLDPLEQLDAQRRLQSQAVHILHPQSRYADAEPRGVGLRVTGQGMGVRAIGDETSDELIGEQRDRKAWQGMFHALECKDPTLLTVLEDLREYANVLSWSQAMTKNGERVDRLCEMFTPEALIAIGYIVDEVMLDVLHQELRQDEDGVDHDAMSD